MGKKERKIKFKKEANEKAWKEEYYLRKKERKKKYNYKKERKKELNVKRKKIQIWKMEKGKNENKLWYAWRYQEQKHLI